LAEMRQALEIEPHDSFRSLLGYLLAKAGRQTEARQLLLDLEKQGQQRRVSPFYLARIYLGLDERDQVIALLQHVVDERSDHILGIGIDPLFDPLRTDPRFIALLKQIGLPQ